MVTPGRDSLLNFFFQTESKLCSFVRAFDKMFEILLSDTAEKSERVSCCAMTEP